MIKASCSNCGKKFKAPEEYVGRKSKCPHCKNSLEITPIEKTPEKPIEYRLGAYLQKFRNECVVGKDGAGKDKEKTQHVNWKIILYTVLGFFILFFVFTILIPSSSNNKTTVVPTSSPEASKDPVEKLIDRTVNWLEKTHSEIEEQRKATPPKTREEIRQEKIERQFSSWDGSHINLKRVVRDNLHNPRSFKHNKTHYLPPDQGVSSFIVVMSFRGENAFGATVLNTARAEVDLDGNIIWWEVE